MLIPVATGVTQGDASGHAGIRSTGSRVPRCSQVGRRGRAGRGKPPGDTMLQSIPTEMTSQSPSAAGRKRIVPRNRLVALGIALCALLASCGDGYGHRDLCYSCGANATPTEVLQGVVSADFNGDGFA